ncbi:MAG: hypothetical protein R3C18_22455 [Planctomycetaceae bacterium]
MARFTTRQEPKLLGRVRGKVRLKQYGRATERAYVNWTERYLRFHKDRNKGQWRHPAIMGKAEVIVGGQLALKRPLVSQ